MAARFIIFLSSRFDVCYNKHLQPVKAGKSNGLRLVVRWDSERPMTALKRIEREPLWDLAHAQLQDALLAGRFEPGTVLTLRSLAESFGTSITPVRDAVTRLVAQGVL